MTVWKTQTSEYILHFPFHIIRYRAMHSFAEFKHDTLSYSYMYSQSQTSEQEITDIFNPGET